MNKPEVAAADIASIHGILATDFTDRYLQKTGFDKFAYSVLYDPEDPLCNYDQTWWPAQPNRLSQVVGKTILGKMHRLSNGEIDELVVGPFVPKTEEIKDALWQYPVMLVNGHSPDLQAALSLMAADIAIARTSEGNTYKNYADMVKISHGVATRGLAPIVAGRPKIPHSQHLTFMRIMQLVVNPHLSFPINKQMIESGIPRDFIKKYNSDLRQGSIDVARSVPADPAGLRTFWSFAPGATPDIPGEGEHEGKILTKRVIPATLDLISEMGVGLMPVYTKFGKGKSPTVVEVGNIIPPNEVTEDIIPGIMADLAEFRRKNGETNVYYEEELAA